MPSRSSWSPPSLFEGVFPCTNKGKGKRQIKLKLNILEEENPIFRKGNPIAEHNTKVYKQKQKKIHKDFTLFYFTLFYITLPYIKGGYFASMIKIIFPLKIFSLTQLGQKECDGSLSSKELKKVCMFRKEGGKNNKHNPQ